MRFGIDENERDRMWRMRTIRVEGEMRGDEREEEEVEMVERRWDKKRRWLQLLARCVVRARGRIVIYESDGSESFSQKGKGPYNFIKPQKGPYIYAFFFQGFLN